jgi:hypothetical protein
LGGDRVVGSRLGMTRWFDEEGAARHRAYVAGSPRRNMDALILAIAEAEGVPFVTAEHKPSNLARMRRYFQTVDILTPPDLWAAAGVPRE